jgi:hypothetical protein
MKRYIKISPALWSQDTITRDDLVKVSQKVYDTIIDTQNGTYFDSDSNSWKNIPGEEN